MTRALFILAVCVATVGCGGGTTKVVQDRSVAQKFAAFNKSGWSVSGGGVNNNPNVPVVYRRVFKPNVAPNAAVNPLGNAVWSTNFHVDAPNGAHVAAGGANKGVNVVGPKGSGVTASASNAKGINATGPQGSGLSVAPVNSGGGMSVNGPGGTGASVNGAGKASTNIFTQIGNFFSGKSK